MASPVNATASASASSAKVPTGDSGVADDRPPVVPTAAQFAARYKEWAKYTSQLQEVENEAFRLRHLNTVSDKKLCFQNAEVGWNPEKTESEIAGNRMSLVELINTNCVGTALGTMNILACGSSHDLSWSEFKAYLEEKGPRENAVFRLVLFFSTRFCHSFVLYHVGGNWTLYQSFQGRFPLRETKVTEAQVRELLLPFACEVATKNGGDLSKVFEFVGLPHLSPTDKLYASVLERGVPRSGLVSGTASDSLKRACVPASTQVSPTPPLGDPKEGAVSKD